MKKLTLALLLISLCLFTASPSRAEDAVSNKTDFTAGSDIIFKTVPEAIIKNDIQEQPPLPIISAESEVTIIKDDNAGKHVLPTVQNISKLYWKKDALSLSDNTAVDNFLLINECEIYERFYSDDFEWERIRKAARGMLKQNKENFPHEFKIIIPIDLGRYDLERKGFPLINKTALKDLRRVEIGGNPNHAPICGKQGNIEGYPRNLILILNKPLTYEFVELDEHVAQAYIIRHKYEATNRPKELETQKFDRLAFLRIRITFSEYQGTTKGSDYYPLGIMFGKLDGIDVFEDASEKRLLTSINIK